MTVPSSILRLLTAGTTLLIASLCPPGSLMVGKLLLSEDALESMLEVIASVAAGNTANALEALPALGEDDGKCLSLENEHLTQTVGKAIAALIYTEAKQQSGDIHEHLKKVAKHTKNNWVKISREELKNLEPSYPELMEIKVGDVITPTPTKLTHETCMTVPKWRELFERLNSEIKSKVNLPSGVINNIAKKLYYHFPKALREALKADFTQQGEAFAGLMLSLLTETKDRLVRLQKEQRGDFRQVFNGLQEIDLRLKNIQHGQVKVFKVLSRRLDSGFYKLLKSLGCIESEITEIWKKLDENREYLSSIKEGVSSIKEDTKEIKEKQELTYQLILEDSLPKRVHQCLLNFDYQKQEYEFDEFIKSTQLGICIVNGLQKCGQPWFLYRMFQTKYYFDDTSTPFNKISCFSRTQKLSLKEEICHFFRLPVNESIEKIYQEIANHLEHKSLVFIVKNIHLTTQDYLDYFVKQFWIPLVQLYQQQPPNNPENRLLFLLVDLEGVSHHWEMSSEQELLSHYRSHTIYRLKQIKPLSWAERQDCLKQLAWDLKRQKIPDEISQKVIKNHAQLTEKFVPHETVLEYICNCCNIDWGDIESKWKRYY